MRKPILIILYLCFIFTPLTMSAAIYGTLKGRILDDEGKPAIGATIMLKGTTQGTMAKADGRFTLVNIPPGAYTVKITYMGQKDQEVQVRIGADQVTEINVQLESEVTKLEGVTVTGNRQMVRKSDIGSIDDFSSSLITSSAREGVTSIVGTAAGVFAAGSGYNIRGARTTETQIRVDGLDVGNQFTGGMGVAGTGYFPMVSSFATEQVQVLKGGFSAEYGEALGGIVNTIVKTGRTDRYEGFLRWRTDANALYGSQDKGLKLVRDGQYLTPVREGEGAKALGNGEHKFETGLGGPLPLPGLNNTTFYLSASYQHENWRGATYDIKDPLGSSLGRQPDNQVWVKNITGRIKFSLTNNIRFIVGGSWGMTNWENRLSLYNNDLGYRHPIEKILMQDGSYQEYFNLNDTILVNMPEAVAQATVGNNLTRYLMVRINHQLADNSFYEITISNTANNDEIAKRKNYNDPNYFTGYELWYPEDRMDANAGRLEIGRSNQVIDNYEQIFMPGHSKDGYVPLELPQRNPYTGYYEGGANSTGTLYSPYGLNAYTHGNSGGFQYRDGTYWQVDGNYTYNFDTGKDFNHMFKTGFELRLFEQHKHSNGNPWDSNPFFDVYTDRWGGNLYAERDAGPDLYDRTSQPFSPTKIAAYVQDQISYKGIIISPGVRLDVFNPNSRYRLDSDQFFGVASDTGFADATWKLQISPRFNVTYPITDMSFVRLSYGIFYKTPALQNLYDGFNVQNLRGNQILGDPNMEAQRTNAYEISYSNQLSDLFAFDIAAYYRDIYNQEGTKWVPATPTFYYQYTVAEYGNSKGIEFTFRKRPTMTDHLGFMINYTLSNSMGTSSSPLGNYLLPLDPYTGQPSYPLAEYPQPWDRAHRINAIIDLIWGPGQGPSIGGIKFLENTNLNFSGRFQSGTPFTRTDASGNPIGEVNSSRLPDFWAVDVRLSKAFRLADYFGDGAGLSTIEVFVDIYNITNRTAAVGVFSRTGDPLDDGVSFYRGPGDFSATPWYKEADFGVAETIGADQYDSYGNRLYNALADHDGNGIVTQDEKYNSWVNALEVSRSFLGNFQYPRTVYFGVLFRF